MDRSLVIVTCNKDRWSFEMLAKSIEKFLQPSKILVIVNEDENESWHRWFENLKYLFQKHDLEIKNKIDFLHKDIDEHLHPLQKSGWINQQVLKLYAGIYLNCKEYVVLDSKNFFIKPLRLSNILQIYPEYIESWAPNNLKNAVNIYCKVFGLNFTYKTLPLTQNTTPYIINRDHSLSLIKKLGNIDNFYKFFTKTALIKDVAAAEFFLYEIYTIKNRRNNTGQCNSNNVGFWHFHIENLHLEINDLVTIYKKNYKNPNIFCSGLHKSLFKHLTIEQIEEFATNTDLLDLLPTHTANTWKC